MLYFTFCRATLMLGLVIMAVLLFLKRLGLRVPSGYHANSRPSYEVDDQQIGKLRAREWKRVAHGGLVVSSRWQL